MIDEGDCGAIGGMKIGRGNRSTRRKPAPAPFCPPQIPQIENLVRRRNNFFILPLQGLSQEQIGSISRPR
jgi:hypothetical protein